MDCTTATEDFVLQIKANQENLLLDIIKDVVEKNGYVSAKLQGKIQGMIAECDLSHYSGLHKMSTADESTSTLLSIMNKTSAELTYDEQVELNEAVLKNIQEKLPKFIAQLEQLSKYNNKKGKKDQITEMKESLDDKLKTLEDQENEKVELMIEWLNHRLQDVIKFDTNSSELLTLKTNILELKSKILHLQILQNIFTETNQSIQAYKEIQNELKQSIKNTEDKIKEYRDIIDSDFL